MRTKKYSNSRPLGEADRQAASSGGDPQADYFSLGVKWRRSRGSRKFSWSLMALVTLLFVPAWFVGCPRENHAPPTKIDASIKIGE
jgi:hypothetical protein